MLTKEVQSRHLLRLYQQVPELRAYKRQSDREAGDKSSRLDSAEYIPTPEQIAEAAAAIREGWSPDERRRRGEPSAGWDLPLQLRAPERRGAERTNT